MIERAVKVSPRCPSFHGLHKMIEHSLEEGGGIATKEFTAHMAQMAEADARVLKQNRLYREELAAKKKETEQAPDSPAPGAAPKRKGKKGGAPAAES